MTLPIEKQMFSQRFQKSVRLTHHVMARMEKRDISLELLLDLIETGDTVTKQNPTCGFTNNILSGMTTWYVLQSLSGRPCLSKP